MNNSEIVDNVVSLINSGNVTDAVEFLMKGRKCQPCKVAILSSMVTESLIKSEKTQELKFFVNKLEYYHNNKVHW